jgi:hypothetical protein
VLTAYFDDSGTHDAASVVVWAGVFGNQFQWDYLSQLWRNKLAQPSPGKEAIKRFHMFDCQNASGEFAGWPRTATDLFVHELTEILDRTMVWGYGSAVSRSDWDELIKGDDLLALLGDSEGQCIRNVYGGSIHWAQEHGHERDIAYIFDKRPHREKENSLIFEVFRSLHEDESIRVKPVSLDFALSSDVPPLQAADLFAWETYQHVKDVVTNGQKITEPKRKTLLRLMSGGRFTIGVATRDRIEKLAKVKPLPGTAEAYAELRKAFIGA